MLVTAVTGVAPPAVTAVLIAFFNVVKSDVPVKGQVAGVPVKAVHAPEEICPHAHNRPLLGVSGDADVLNKGPPATVCH